MTEALVPAPSPFAPDLPTFQVAWDSTSLGLLKECAYKYKLSILDQWAPRSKNVHLIFGGLYASALERYAHARASGSDHDASVLTMVQWALEASGERPDNVWTPWGTGPDADPIKNRYTLIRTLVWNAEDRRDSGYKTLLLANGKPATELSFRFSAFNVGPYAITLAGHLDEVCTDPGNSVWIRDDKTSKNALSTNWWNQWTPNNQMSLYTIAGKVILNRPVAGVLVRGAQIGVNFARFAQRPVPRPPAVLAEWMEDTQRWIALALHYAREDYWPRNDKSCSNYGGCPFQRVCAVSPSHRLAWLKEDFVLREWNPLASRGDI